MEEKIIEIIVNLTGENRLKENKNIDLIENDIIDSLTFIQLITTLEDIFNIEIQPTQIAPDTWRSVKKISRLVEQLK